MRVLLLQLDGKMPNLALMRLSAHHKALGNAVDLSINGIPKGDYDAIFASAIFTKSKQAIDDVLSLYPNAVVGGTGSGYNVTLEELGLHDTKADYSLYPDFDCSIGFTQRGCRYKCPFCVIPEKEGRVTEAQNIHEIWRGEPYPKKLILLDGDFFGQPNWRDRIEEICEGGFKVCFMQGINVRTLKKDEASALASIDYRDTKFKTRRIYTAWDNTKDERAVFRGIELLLSNGVKADNLMVYMLIGYRDDETVKDWEYRRRCLRKLGVRPYPMTYKRNRLTVGYQRWIIGAYDKRIKWKDWERARYNPRNLNRKDKIMARMKMDSGPDLVTLNEPIEAPDKNKYTHGIVIAPHDIARGKLIAIEFIPFNPTTGHILIAENGTPARVARLVEEVTAFKVKTPGRGRKPGGKNKKGKDGGGDEGKSV